MSATSLVSRFRQEQARTRLASRYAAAKAPAFDTGAAEAAATKAEARYKANHKTQQALKKGDPHDKAYRDGYGKLFKSGDEGAKAAGEIVRKYEDDLAQLKGAKKQLLQAALTWLDDRVRNWNHTKSDMGSFSRNARLGDVYAAAQQLEAALRGFPSVLQGKEEPLDESWRDH
jgi:hypothetical protein